MPTTLPQRTPNADPEPEKRLLFPMMVAMWAILVLSLVELYALGYSFRSHKVIASLNGQDGYGVSDVRSHPRFSQPSGE
jgi:hypothetical protein